MKDFFKFLTHLCYIAFGLFLAVWVALVVLQVMLLRRPGF